MELVLYGRPITKKNSSRIITKPYPRLIPSKQFVSYNKNNPRIEITLERI